MRNAKLILLVLLVVAFLPYLYTCFCALPFADDFCFGWTASEKISFTQKFLNQYLHWNGRYTSDVMVNLHPLTSGSLLLYQLVSFASVLATPLVFFVFTSRWIQNIMSSAIVALFILLFYLCYLPNIAEGVYWYIGLANYHWGILLFILQITMLHCLLNREKSRTLTMVCSLLLLALSVGFNEIGAALIPAFYFAMLICFRVNKELAASNSGATRVLIIHFAVAFIASAFVICSPGNFTRESAFPERFNVIHSALFASLQTIRFIVHWVSSIPFIALSLVVMVNADKVKSAALKKVHPAVWTLLILFTVFTAALLPYLATGILGQHRTMNYVFPFFIILWIGLLLSLSARYRLTEEAIPETTGSRVFILAFVALTVMSFTGNARKIMTDFYSDTFPKYKSEFMARQSAILGNPAKPVPPLKTIPKTFEIVDVKSDTAWWVDKCVRKFYTETKVVLQ